MTDYAVACQADKTSIKELLLTATACLLQRLPSIACFTTITCVSYILYALVAPYGLKINCLTPQAVVLVLCTSGIAACVVTTLAIPTIVRKFGSVAPPEVQIKRMNLLGLVSSLLSLTQCTCEVGQHSCQQLRCLLAWCS